MPSKKPYIQIRSNESVIAKFSKLAEIENRSMSNLGEYIVKQYISAYEAEHGEIDIKNTPPRGI